MIVKNVLFHNVCELEQREHLPGLRLQRFPKEVRDGLGDKGRTKAVQSNNCEMRFVTDARTVRVTLSSVESGGKIGVFKGDFFHSAHQLQAGVMQTFSLEEPERFAEVVPDRLNNRAFGSNVWRIFFERFGAVFHDIDAFGHEVRPPEASELPKLRFVAYGSSITQGVGAVSHYNCYVQQAARRLEADVLNLGLSGSCLCEKAAADHIASRGDWDFAFLEIGVNMRSVFTVEEFESRASYLLDRVIERNPDKPVFLTTIYPNRATHFNETKHALTDHEKRYNDVLRNYAAAKAHPQLHLLEGADILTDFTALTSDLIHPSDYGHMLMGERLAEMMRPVAEQLREQRKQGEL
ncbi:SGNH/GDSL hydrolase family protein [Paenibacillus allorhizosphaerae]|uniref:SGNH hydrolase-type esterase domain-containing protein n=1 Tax=Paenibacillus allorhizosphaerae TaxID=2849866 RepID=A0ABN7TK59_9BACL|nr:GDSL-type esterase/lipase family protein [Paenibacillus allorhizosphaerae]CAG7642677.1 hypothetical protein PAECIP111802_02888 [Paenibacillus allorhizosphaerae]